MRKLRALIVSMAVVGGALFAFGSAPAQADSIRYVYYYQSDCYNGGYLGIQWGWWTNFNCAPANFYPGDTRWVLWA
ncbi:hypothetical protein GCM10009677_01310 [Sphaerisporangium rubeum]|uniref:Chitin-binding type-3 domain-containing protein n=1 Tax=Sphaerisporangium rubeum TaxID=321317 RepID=A0A7X0IFL7_9ACTN|nr:hypothetical protein [Sphaerisporangium rubeum]MBB6473083.1 hypothetical protein [Sphaerisporangium rubeum]